MTLEEVLDGLREYRYYVDAISFIAPYFMNTFKTVALVERKFANEFFQDMISVENFRDEVRWGDKSLWDFYKEQLKQIRINQIDSLESKVEVSVKGQNDLNFLIQHKEHVEENIAFEHKGRWYLVKTILFTNKVEKGYLSKIEAAYAF